MGLSCWTGATTFGTPVQKIQNDTATVCYMYCNSCTVGAPAHDAIGCSLNHGLDFFSYGSGNALTVFPSYSYGVLKCTFDNCNVLQGSNLLCEGAPSPPCDGCAAAVEKAATVIGGTLIAAIVTPLIVVILIVVIALILCCKCANRKQPPPLTTTPTGAKKMLSL